MRVIDAGCRAVFLTTATGNKGQDFMDFQERWGRIRRGVRNKLWLRPALASLFSVLAAFAALWAEMVVPEEAGFKIDEDSLVSILSIFASSMLSVATFTVSAIVAAASSASTSTTPRATRQVISDAKAQMVLSAFIAAFIYSFIAIIALKIFQYGAAGRLMLFAGLVVMVVFVLISFINWIDQAMKLGRQSTTIAKLKEVAETSITPATAGTFGARPFTGVRPGDGAVVRSGASGYVSALGLTRLQKCAESEDCHVVLLVRPGEYCSHGYQRSGDRDLHHERAGRRARQMVPGAAERGGAGGAVRPNFRPTAFRAGDCGGCVHADRARWCGRGRGRGALAKGIGDIGAVRRC
jgi:uncharacterized membrane protein